MDGGDFDVVGRVVVDSSGAATLDNVNKSLDGMQSKTSLLSKVTQGFGDISKFVWANIVLQGVQMAQRAIGDFFRDVITKGEQAQQVQAQLNAVIKSTGGIAGMTAAAVNDYAQKMMLVTRFDDEAIVGAQNMLLTFTNIGKDVFPQATTAVLDLATGMHEDLQSAAVQIGKALNDPIQGVTALRRVGVQLSDDQKKQVEQFMKVNDVASAQAVILKELQKEFGGSAEAAGATFAGKMDILKNRIDNMKESIFDWLSASPLVAQFFDIANKGIDTLSTFIKNITSGKNLADALGDLGIPQDAALRLQAIAMDVQRIFANLAKGDLKDAFHSIGDLWKNLTDDVKTAFQKIDWKKASQDLAKGISSIDWRQLGKDLTDGVANIFSAVAAFLGAVDWGALFSSTIGAFIDVLKGVITDHGDEIASTWGADFAQLGHILSILGHNNIVVPMQKFFSDVRTNIVTAVVGWISAIKTKASDFTTAGRSIVDGLLEGLKNSWDRVVSWITNAMQGLLASAMAAVEGQSPSKVWKRFAKDVIMAGMGLGIGEGFEMPVHAIMKGMPLLQTAALGGSAQATHYHGGNSTYNRQQHFGAVNNFFVSGKQRPDEVLKSLRKQG